MELKNRFFTENTAWDTGAEVSIFSFRVIKAIGLKPFDHSTIVGIGGDEEVYIYKVHLGLPNGYLYKNRYVYCSDMVNYDILIGMDIIAKSDFFLTNIDGNSRFFFPLASRRENRIDSVHNSTQHRFQVSNWKKIFSQLETLFFPTGWL